MVVHWYPERRRRFERPLLDHYHATLLASGVKGYDRAALDYELPLGSPDPSDHAAVPVQRRHSARNLVEPSRADHVRHQRPRLPRAALALKSYGGRAISISERVYGATAKAWHVSDWRVRSGSGTKSAIQPPRRRRCPLVARMRSAAGARGCLMLGGRPEVSTVRTTRLTQFGTRPWDATFARAPKIVRQWVLSRHLVKGTGNHLGVVILPTRSTPA